MDLKPSSPSQKLQFHKEHQTTPFAKTQLKIKNTHRPKVFPIEIANQHQHYNTYESGPNTL